MSWSIVYIYMREALTSWWPWRGPPLFSIPSPSSKLLVKSFHRTVFWREDNKPHSLELLFGRKSWLSAWGEKGKEQIEFILTQCSHAFSPSTFQNRFNAEGLHRNILLICTLNAAVTKVFICLYKVCICMSAQIKFKFAVYVIKFISKCLLIN